jgi:hypothetical protein
MDIGVSALMAAGVLCGRRLQPTQCRLKPAPTQKFAARFAD